MNGARRLTVLAALVTAISPKVSASAQDPQQQGSAASGRLTISTSSAPARAEFWAGLEEWQTGAYSSGERHFRRALALDEWFALARLFATGEVASSREQVLERERGVSEAARQSAEEGVLALAWREKALGHRERARILFGTALQLMPNEPAVAVEYVWSHLGSEINPKQSLDTARAYRKRFPSYAPLILPLTTFSLNAGDTAGALRAAEEFMRAAPRTPAAFGYYGSFLQLLGRFDEAEAAYRKGLNLGPAHADYGGDPASRLVELYGLRGRNADARAMATQALLTAASPNDSATYMTEIAGTYFVAGDARQGMQILESARRKSAIAGSPIFPVRLDEVLAEADAVFGDVASVGAYLARLTPVEPDDRAAILLTHAMEYAYAGQLDSAQVYAERLANSTSVSWRELWSHRARGIAFASAKQCERAQAELMPADTADLLILSVRADCEMQRGHREAALTLRDRAMATQDFSYMSPALLRARMRLAQMK
jgi:tetratricopeptide (TPR) repeat protein